MARDRSRSRSRDRRRRDEDDRDVRERSRRHEDDGERERKRRRSRSPSRERERGRERSERKDSKRSRDKSAERKARKAEKRRLKLDEEARRVAELSVYSAQDNPFHDTNLSAQFKWHKKSEAEKKAGLSAEESARRDARRRQEAKDELEKLNRRRAEREAEMRLREEEEARAARQAESAHMAQWVAKDGDFQLAQERRRAAIRIREKRARAVDFLALNLRYANPDAQAELEGEEDDEGAGLEIDLDEPYNIFDNLGAEQVEELHGDIARYLSLETSDLNLEFWTNMMVVCKDRLDALHADARTGRAASAAVAPEVTALLANKSHEHLVTLQRQVQAKLAGNEPVDTDYWEGLLAQLLVWKAKARLRGVHQVVVRNRLEHLRRRQRDEARAAQEELLEGVAKSAASGAAPAAAAAGADGAPVPYARGMSPAVIDITMLPPDERQLDIVLEADDRAALFAHRRAVISSRFIAKAPAPEAPAEPAAPADPASTADLASEALYRAEAERDMDEEEELLDTEERLAAPAAYAWEDKHRPRKPRYFNRVHTGYEWNKYNQTHYDTDNPPPKVVQGYKFNIFYPDLIDKARAPAYRIVKEEGNEDTVLLHFSAGPPYEDVAFRIVHREWEYSHKRGFRSSFDRGCLSLWFNFKRNFYRK